MRSFFGIQLITAVRKCDASGASAHCHEYQNGCAVALRRMILCMHSSEFEIGRWSMVTNTKRRPFATHDSEAFIIHISSIVIDVNLLIAYVK